MYTSDDDNDDDDDGTIIWCSDSNVSGGLNYQFRPLQQHDFYPLCRVRIWICSFGATTATTVSLPLQLLVMVVLCLPQLLLSPLSLFGQPACLALPCFAFCILSVLMPRYYYYYCCCENGNVRFISVEWYVVLLLWLYTTVWWFIVVTVVDIVVVVT